MITLPIPIHVGQLYALPRNYDR